MGNFVYRCVRSTVSIRGKTGKCSFHIRKYIKFHRLEVNIKQMWQSQSDHFDANVNDDYLLSVNI